MKKLVSYLFPSLTIPFEEELLESIKNGNLIELKQYIDTKSIDPTLPTKVKFN